MKNIRTFIIALIIFGAMPVKMVAQFYGQAYVQYGYGIFKYKSDELGVFLNSYNSEVAPDTPFDLDIPALRGDFIKFGVGFGENLGMVLDFTLYKLESKPLSARFNNGSGRDVWLQVRNSNTNVGIRFGGTKEIPIWGQFNINIAIQTMSIASAWVFPDGSRSLGRDHALNGIYSSFNITGGFGLAVGYRVFGPLAVTAAVDRCARGFDYRKHPEYYQYDDNNDVGNANGYVPKSYTAFINGAYGSENSISNDFRGWQFTFGAVLMLSSDQK